MTGINKIFLIIFYLVFSYSGIAQDSGSAAVSLKLPLVALLDIEPGTSPVSLNFIAPSEAGLPVISPSNNSKWLNYTSTISAKKGTNRQVTVELSAGTVPDGVLLSVEAGSYSGTGAGATGIPLGQVAIPQNKAVAIIDNIGCAYTGNGMNNGHNITYTAEVTDYTLIKDQTATLIVTYTLTDR